MTSIFQQRYYKINTFFLRAIGQWPYESCAKRFAGVVMCLLLTVSMLIPQLKIMQKLSYNWAIVIENIPHLTTHVAYALKLTNLFINSDKMLKMLKRIEIDWKYVLEQPKELHMLREYAETGRQLTIIYAAGVYVSMVLFMIEPSVTKFMEANKPINGSEPRKFPFPIDYYGVDLDTNYNYILLHCFISVTTLLTVIICVETFFIVQVQHACGMFSVVGHQLKKMADGVSEDQVRYSRAKEDPNFRYMTLCIRKHNDVIEFSKLLEASYTWSFLISVGCNMLVISITGFQAVTTMNKSVEEAIRWAGFAMVQLIHLFFQSFFSQRLMDHSQRIHEHLYQAEWYRTPVYTQRLLNPIAMRSLVPCQLTAGGFVVMSLETFGSVVKASMSYFTLLRRSMQ